MIDSGFLTGFLAGAAVVFILLPLFWHLRFLISCCFLGLLRKTGAVDENHPRSLSGTEAMVLPIVKRDFPEFDPEAAKTLARTQLEARFGQEPEFLIHRITVSDYHSPGKLSFQAAVRQQAKKPGELRLELSASIRYDEAGNLCFQWGTVKES